MMAKNGGRYEGAVDTYQTVLVSLQLRVRVLLL